MARRRAQSHLLDTFESTSLHQKDCWSVLPANSDTPTVHGTFSRPICDSLYLPAAGVEVLEIIETQLLHRQTDGSLEVESRPVLAAPGASKFTTHVLFSMSEAVNGTKSCKVQNRLVNTCVHASCTLQHYDTLVSMVALQEQTPEQTIWSV